MFLRTRYFGPFYSPDGGAGGGSDDGGDGGTGDGGSGGGKDATYWQTEAQKAFKDRDAVKAKLRDIEGRLPTDEQMTRWKEIEAAAEQAEQERKKKAGEFDALLAQANKKYEANLAAERAKQAEIETREQAAIRDMHDLLIGLAFAGASEWFGPDGKTVLPADVAQSHLGRYVEVKTEDGDRTVVVKDQGGNPIIDPKTGRPLAFAKAIGELIETLPSKDRLLRGSGKAGSGNSGGANGAGGGRDLSSLKATDFQDPKVREAVRQNMANAGGLQIGPAFDRMKR